LRVRRPALTRAAEKNQPQDWHHDRPNPSKSVYIGSSPWGEETGEGGRQNQLRFVETCAFAKTQKHRPLNALIADHIGRGQGNPVIAPSGRLLLGVQIRLLGLGLRLFRAGIVY
jgi:hypothetical protein